MELTADSTGSPPVGTVSPLGVSALGAGIVLRERAAVSVAIRQRNAAWWHALSVVSPENRGPPATVGPCGPLDDSERMFLLEHYAPLFTSDDEDPTASRADFELERVSSGEPIHVVERRGDCALVVAAAFRILNDEILSGRPVTRSSENWAVLRFGPYYLVPIYPRPSERIVVQQYGQVLIFAVQDLQFLIWFLG